MTTRSISPLRQRMIEDMNARQLAAGTQRGHVRSCKRFTAFLERSPDTASSEDIRRFQLLLAEAGVSIGNRNRIMTGLRFLFRVTLRRPDLAGEIYHIREPQKIPLVMSTDETRRLLAVAPNLKVRVLLSLAYGCGLRAGEVVRLSRRHRQRADDHPRRAGQGARIATSCCRPRCSVCCADGGRSARRAMMRASRRHSAGCFLGARRTDP